MQRLWIVTEFFYPDETATAYILTNIANCLSEKYDIHVLAGPIMSDIPSVSHVDGRITIHRGRWLRLGKEKLLPRAISFIIMTTVLSIKLLCRSRRGDKVMIATNPASLHPIVSLLKKMKGFELVVLTHDLFPENTIPAGIFKSKKSVLYGLLMRVYDQSYARADKIIVIGRDMKELMEAKIRRFGSLAKIRVISNWADLDIIHAESDVPDNQIVIQYAGNIGRVQGLKWFLDVFRKVKDEGVEFSIWGKGVLATEITHYAETNHIRHVKVNGPFTRSEENGIIRQCDLCLISLAEGMYGLGVPSKAYNIMAAGKPVLYVGPENSELWRVVMENGLGFCFAPGDEDGLLQFLNSLTTDRRPELLKMGERAKKLAYEQYAKEKVLGEIYHFV